MPEPKKIERWVSVLAEEIGCSCRPSEDVARMIQDAVDARRKRGPGRETQITPYVDAWRQTYGGEPTYGLLAKYVGIVEKAADSPGTALRSFVRYINDTEAAYVSLPKWAATWASWIPRVPL